MKPLTFWLFLAGMVIGVPGQLGFAIYEWSSPTAFPYHWAFAAVAISLLAGAMVTLAYELLER